MTLPEIPVAVQTVLYVLAAIALGHLIHELLHVLTAVLMGCERVRVDWPHVRCAGGPLQRLTVAVCPLLIGVVATGLYALAGPWWLSLGGLIVPHPMWFGLVALSTSGKDDLGAVITSGRQAWFLYRLVR